LERTGTVAAADDLEQVLVYNFSEELADVQKAATAELSQERPVIKWGETTLCTIRGVS
jgi:hypothetical protein